MKSSWSDAQAQTFAQRAEADGYDRQLGLRIYTSQIIGQDPDLVMHGGGNTSVKVTARDGTRLMHIKGSGWDLGNIEAPGLPAVRLEPLLGIKDGPKLSDPEMVRALRDALIDPSAPNPSVEALLHGFIDEAFVDHCHSTAVLALANQTGMKDRVRALYEGRVAFVPYVMPGFDLSIEGEKIYSRNTGCEGLWLENHGLFTFGADARTSYERMIEFVTIAEGELKAHHAGLAPAQDTDADAPALLLAGLVEVLGEYEGPFGAAAAWDFRSNAAIRSYLDLPDLCNIVHRGTATPDHVIRIKPFPLIVKPDADRSEMRTAVDSYRTRYADYFNRNAALADTDKIMLDPLPRVVLIPGVGLAGIAPDAKAAKIAADLAEQTARIVLSAERYGRFSPIGEKDLFDMEYWSLEQAKLSKQ
ncbi:class II aldolase/adducin family protein [Pelagibacterium sediminicola]|uniref:class II aldolase/adducin family protein n=1 Tax=Pelagibacterium sediminicola TaxID=2248761 RepID=UPI000E322F37|nr:class II aldolase/adducin family protein [Pelagibacterium sediminicola]